MIYRGGQATTILNSSTKDSTTYTCNSDNCRFEWQRGFGVFSYIQSNVQNVYKYIEQQEEHHKKQVFKEEYLQLLKAFEVEYDEAYLFEDLV